MEDIMDIALALKETGKAQNNTYSSLYATWINGNVTFFDKKHGMPDRPLEHHELLKGGWQSYHEVKEIKPCPFCGNHPEIRKRKTVIIECKGCGVLFIKLTKEEAIQAWNKRAL